MTTMPTRRSILQTLLALPFVARLVPSVPTPKAAPPAPSLTMVGGGRIDFFDDGDEAVTVCEVHTKDGVYRWAEYGEPMLLDYRAGAEYLRWRESAGGVA